MLWQKNKTLKRLRSVKNIVSVHERDESGTDVNRSLSDTLNEVEIGGESSGITDVQVEWSKQKAVQSSKGMNASKILIGMPKFSKQQQEIETKESNSNQSTQIGELASLQTSNVIQPNLSMSHLMSETETSHKVCDQPFPRTPNLNNILPELNTT